MDTSIAPGPSASGPPTNPLADSTHSKQPAAANTRTRLHSEEEEEDETSDTEKPPNKKVRVSIGRNTQVQMIHFIIYILKGTNKRFS